MDSGVVIATIIVRNPFFDVREKPEKVGKSWGAAHSKTRLKPKLEAGFYPIDRISAES
jgi:hypothetical protein